MTNLPFQFTESTKMYHYRDSFVRNSDYPYYLPIIICKIGIPCNFNANFRAVFGLKS